MASENNLTTIPTLSGTIDQQFFLTPLAGPTNPINYLDGFPSQIYNKSLDSHLVKFMYALLGPSGLGWIAKNYLETRLLLEEYGIEGPGLDLFYGDPIRFGRILEEIYQRDPGGLIPRDKWNEIRVKDSLYRSRALNYIAGVRAGGTLLGMELVAKSGLGHEASVTENYRALYDMHSDFRLGIAYQGKTQSTEEMIIAPIRETPQSEVQKITVIGNPTDGFFKLYLPLGDPANFGTEGIAYNADVNIIQIALEDIVSIGKGNVEVTGGPLPESPIFVKFTNELSYKDVPELQIDISGITGDFSTNAIVETVTEGVSSDDQPTSVSLRDQRYLLTALDYIKPVTSVVTFLPGSGGKQAQIWNEDPFATSQYQEVVRYVTGIPSVKWPDKSKIYWVEKGVEHEAPRAFNDLQYHYQAFHNLSSVHSYTEGALMDPNYDSGGWDDLGQYRDYNLGDFSDFQRLMYGHLNWNFGDLHIFGPDQAIAEYPEPLVFDSSTEQSTPYVTPTQLVNGIYPSEYFGLPGVNPIKDSGGKFWATRQRVEGDDYLEIDLGKAQAVNFISFEISNKPCVIDIECDILDQAPDRKFASVVYDDEHSSSRRMIFDSTRQNPWVQNAFLFSNAQNETTFTRFVRLKLSRSYDLNSPFLEDSGNKLEHSFEIQNLRIGRNVA